MHALSYLALYTLQVVGNRNLLSLRDLNRLELIKSLEWIVWSFTSLRRSPEVLWGFSAASQDDVKIWVFHSNEAAKTRRG
jgi:hypothetical protein